MPTRSILRLKVNVRKLFTDVCFPPLFKSRHQMTLNLNVSSSIVTFIYVSTYYCNIKKLFSLKTKHILYLNICLMFHIKI